MTSQKRRSRLTAYDRSRNDDNNERTDVEDEDAFGDLVKKPR
jgi:hypothetical protein